MVTTESPSCEKSIRRKNPILRIENRLFLKRDTVTITYYPISALLSVKWSFTKTKVNFKLYL